MNPRVKDAMDERWADVEQLHVLIPGDKCAAVGLLLHVYLEKLAGKPLVLESWDDLESELVDAIRARLPEHVRVAILPRGEGGPPIHGVVLLRPDGSHHSGINLWPNAHQVAREALTDIAAQLVGTA